MSTQIQISHIYGFTIISPLRGFLCGLVIRQVALIGEEDVVRICSTVYLLSLVRDSILLRLPYYHTRTLLPYTTLFRSRLKERGPGGEVFYRHYVHTNTDFACLRIYNNVTPTGFSLRVGGLACCIEFGWGRIIKGIYANR